MKVWNWDGFFSYFTNGYLLQGILVTIGLTLSTLILGMVLGLLLTLMRLSGNRWLSLWSQGYVWVFRGTPLLVQLILIYTGLPQFGRILITSLNELGVPLPLEYESVFRFTVTQSAVIGLALNEAAYLSEILRGGILSVGQGQRDAAMSLGLTRMQSFSLIVMPQALRVIMPALGNSVNGLLKTTSIASVISMEELLRRGQILMQQKFEVLEIFIVVAIMYLAMTTLWDAVQRRIERSFGRAYGDTMTKQLARDNR